MSDFPNYYTCTDPKCGDNRCAERQEKAMQQAPARFNSAQQQKAESVIHEARTGIASSQQAGRSNASEQNRYGYLKELASLGVVEERAIPPHYSDIARDEYARMEKALVNLARTDKLPRLAITVDNGFVSALIGGESVSLERIKLMADALAALEADGRRVQAAFGDKAVERG